MTALLLLRWCSLLAILCSCTPQRIASQKGRSLRGVTGDGPSFTATENGIHRRQHQNEDDDDNVQVLDDVTEVVVSNEHHDGESDESLVKTAPDIPAIPAPEPPTAAPTHHHHKNKGGGDDTAAVVKSPSPTAPPTHHHKKDPTPPPSVAPKETEDPTQAPTVAPRTRDDDALDDDDQVPPAASPTDSSGNEMAEIKEMDAASEEATHDVPQEETGEATDDVPQQASSTSTPQDPTKKPMDEDEIDSTGDDIPEDDLVARDDDPLKDALKVEETEAKVFGGFGFIIAIVAMVFTAHQMSENPDGIYASLCRLAITIVSCIIKAVLMPFRSMFGHRGYYHGGHMPISTTDPYRSHQMELT